MKRIIKLASMTILFAYVGVGIFLYVYQREFLYHPTKPYATNYKEMTLKNEHTNINIIVLNEGHKNAILYFGGNAESMAKSADYIAGQFPQFTVYLMDYRGYGKSTGVPSEEGIYSDALKLYDYVSKKHCRISVGGRSLGTGIATYVAAHREVKKLALITPYDSIVNVAKGRYPMYPVSWLLDDRYDSEVRASSIKAETLIVIAEKDRVIPFERTKELIDAFEKTPEIITIKNRGHVDISSDKRYYKIMQDFIAGG